MNDKIKDLLNLSQYNRLFRPGGAGRTYGWHFRVLTIATSLGYFFGLMYILERHVTYQMRLSTEEARIRTSYEWNFTEMAPQELNNYVKSSSEKMSPEWTGTKEFLWKTTYTKVNNHVQNLNDVSNKLDQLEAQIDQLNNNRKA
jgi:uncharacterized protein YukE